MANTQDIRRRIKSIRNTAQITKAMQMVAASKMRKAQQHALAGRPPIEEETNSASKLRELKDRPVNMRAAAPKISRDTSRIIERMLAPQAEGQR